MPSLTRALRGAVLRAGCEVVSESPDVGGLACSCPDTQAKVDLLNSIALLSACDPEIASFALSLRRGWREDRAFAAGVVAWTQKHVRWIEEPGERFQAPRLTLSSRLGDCDCSAMLIAALCLATGLSARVVGLADQNGDGIHAAAQVELEGRWIWAEASVADLPLGSDPRDVMRDPLARPAGMAAAPGRTTGDDVRDALQPYGLDLNTVIVGGSAVAGGVVGAATGAKGPTLGRTLGGAAIGAGVAMGGLLAFFVLGGGP